MEDNLRNSCFDRLNQTAKSKLKEEEPSIAEFFATEGSF